MEIDNVNEQGRLKQKVSKKERERDKEQMQEHGQNMRRKKWTAIAPQQQMKYEKNLHRWKKKSRKPGHGSGLKLNARNHWPLNGPNHGWKDREVFN